MNYFKLISDPNISREYTKKAKKTILVDLYDKNLYGKDRAIDLEFWEDEKYFKEVSLFIPGCFYIFRHDGQIIKNQEGKEFHDVVPIFLALSVGTDREGEDKYVLGINFNVLTKPVRAAILQELNDADPKFFDNLFLDRWNKKHTYSKTIVKMFIGPRLSKFCERICQKYKIDKKSVAFRKYFIKNISKVRLIDYWQWKFLPFLDFEKGIRGVNLAKLQKESIN